MHYPSVNAANGREFVRVRPRVGGVNRLGFRSMPGRGMLCPVFREAGCVGMRNKRERQALILELVQARPISSQEELRRLLAGQGWEVTQATLSRDLRDLGLARVTTEDGIRYVIPETFADDSRPALGATLTQFFASVAGFGEL